jgi:hypothetical protein
MKLYFFNSLYLLTNKTQMKMKKTQSLKLMLLGLMASVSTSALAAVGDIFYDTNTKLFFEELAEDKAMVIGVTSTDGKITIPDYCLNTWDNNKKLYITEVSNDWFGKTTVETRHFDGEGNLVKSDVQAFDLSSYNGLIELTVDATQLKKINAAALIPLNNKIVKFVVTSQAGLEEIDDFSFANPTDVESLNPTAIENWVKNQRKAINDAKAAYEAADYAINKQPAIVEGKYNATLPFAEYDGYPVYVGVTGGLIGIPFILGEETGARDAFNIRNRVIYVIDTESGNLTKFGVVARPRYDNDNKETDEAVFVASQTDIQTIGWKLTKEGTVNTLKASYNVDPETLTSKPVSTGISGLQAIKDYYTSEYQNMLEAKADFEAIMANPKKATSDAPNQVLYWLKDATTKKEAAEAAYEKAYGTNELGHNTADSPYGVWQDYEANSAVSKAVKAGLIKATTVYDPTNQYGAGRTLTEDEFKQVKLINNAMAAAGYTKNSNQGYDRPSFTTIKENLSVANQNYDKLLGFAEDLIAYNNGKKAFEDDHTTKIMDITFGTTADAIAYLTTQATGLTYPQLCAAIPEILAAADAVSEALEAAKQTYASNKDFYDTWKDVDDFDLEDMAKNNPDLKDHNYTAGKNTVLKNVDIDNAPALATIGESAFQNCSEAVFDGTAQLPVTLKKVEANAFNGASLFAPDFTTLVNLEEIGDYAFAYTATTDGDFAAATGLKTVGENIFEDCSIINLMLAGTALEAMPKGLAQCLHKEPFKYIDACGDYYNYSDEDLKTTFGFTIAEIAQLKKDHIVYYDENNPKLVNISLVEASLPNTEKFVLIPDLTYFECINLATLTGGIPATVEEIGEYAFFGTKITEFNLSLNTKLTKIGNYAFGGNKELTKVTLPQAVADGYPGLTELPDGVFQCDKKLSEVILDPEMQCLPEGLFEGSAIETLDLSNTQVTVIPNLFKATATNPNTTLKYVILPDTKYAADNYTMTQPGVRVIGDNAFAHMHALIGQSATVKKFVVPASVQLMGSYVFKNDQALEEVEFTKYSKLTKLGTETFNSTPKLKKVTFLTENCIDKKMEKLSPLSETIDDLTGCDDMNSIVDASKLFGFRESIFASTGRNPKTQVIVTKESYDALITDYYDEGYQQAYTILVADEPTVAVVGPYNDDAGNPMYASTYYSENFGTWVPMAKSEQGGANVTVWTAYQDCDVIYAYPAKHNNGYYKIPAAGYLKKSDIIGGLDPYRLIPDASSATPARLFAPKEATKEQVLAYLSKMSAAELLALLSELSGDDTDVIAELLKQIDEDSIAELLDSYEEEEWNDLLEALLETGEFIEMNELVKAILAEMIPTTQYTMFAAQTLRGTYIYGPTVKYRPGSAAVIITSDKDQPVNIELHSTQDYKYQSTLDWKNELKVAGKPLTTTTDDDVYKFSADTDGWGFFKQVTEIPEGKVVFPMSGYQGTAYPDFKDPTYAPSRMNIVFLNGDFTGIEDVKQYVQKMKESGAIYNMNGIRVTTPVKGQMYIQNGKKFIQK